MDNIDFSFLDNFTLFERKIPYNYHYVFTDKMPSFIEMRMEDVIMKEKFFYKNMMPNEIDVYDLINYDSRLFELRNEFVRKGMKRPKRRAIRAYNREKRLIKRVDDMEEKRVSHMRDTMRKRRKDFNKLKRQKSAIYPPLPRQNCVNQYEDCHIDDLTIIEVN